MSKRLQLTIEGEPGAISFATFAIVVRNSCDILTDLDSAISARPRGTLEWFVTEVSFGSLVIAIEPKSKLPDVDYGPQVAESFVDGMNHIQRERTTPPFFSDYGLRKALEVTRKLGKTGARAVIITDLDRHRTATLYPEASTSLEQLINIRYQEVGSVEGTLEMISVHGAPRFTVYHAVTQRSVRCKFDPRRFLDAVKEALGRRVMVSGLIHLNYVHEPVRVDIEDLRILPKEEELPTPEAMRAMSPDFTGTSESGEYVRSLRGD